jgi:hypothetical protein
MDSENKVEFKNLLSSGFNKPTLVSSFPRKRESSILDARVRGSDEITRCLRQDVYLIESLEKP